LKSKKNSTQPSLITFDSDLLKNEKSNKLIETNDSMPQPTTAEIQQKIPTHKYPFIHKDYITVDDIRSRVHHGTLGPLPMRQSNEIEDLKFLMKGKQLPNPLINEQLEENEQIRATQNTRISYFSTSDPNNVEQFDENDISDEKLPWLLPKPAIMASKGTLGPINMINRPKPITKYKTKLVTINKNEKKISKNENESEQVDIHLDDKTLTENDIKNQINNILMETKQLVGNYNSKKKAKKRNKKIETNQSMEKHDTKIYDEKEEADEEEEERNIQRKVEYLISNIKSGQLKREQAKSNKQIYDILSKVIDSESLQLFNSTLNEDDDDDDQNNDNIIEENQVSIEPQLKEEEPDEKLEDDNIKIDTQLVIEQNVEDENNDEIKLKESIDLTYNIEIESFLASLPPKVNAEELINANAIKIKIYNKTNSTKIERELKINGNNNDIKRNLHHFCMLEDERRQELLLPDELANVTRKFHTRNKFLKKVKKH
jgi:hypothetical protein